MNDNVVLYKVERRSAAECSFIFVFYGWQDVGNILIRCRNSGSTLLQ